MDRANVCVIMIDAVEGFTEQDSKIAGIALEAGKACIVAVNKWDAVEKDSDTMKEYKQKLSVDFHSCLMHPFCLFLRKQVKDLINCLSL